MAKEQQPKNIENVDKSALPGSRESWGARLIHRVDESVCKGMFSLIVAMNATRKDINTRREIIEATTLISFLSGAAGAFAVGLPTSMIDNQKSVTGLLAGFGAGALMAGIPAYFSESARVQPAPTRLERMIVNGLEYYLTNTRISPVKLPSYSLKRA